MADRIIFSQDQLEYIGMRLRGIAGQLEEASSLLNQVDCSESAGGNVRIHMSTSLSGIAGVGNLHGFNVQETVGEYIHAIQSYHNYCDRLAGAVNRVSATFVDKERQLAANGSGENKQSQYDEMIQAAKNILDKIKERFHEMAKHFMGILSDMFCLDGDPVNMFSGNYYDEISLLTIHNASKMQFKVYYNSKMIESSALGFGWTHNFMDHLFLTEDALNLMHADMACEVFTKDEDGNYYSQYNYDVIHRTEAGYRWEKQGGDVYHFDREGTLTAVETVQGSRTTLSYVEGVLIKVEDRFGSVFHFEYDDRGRLTAVKDHTGRTVRFRYEGALLTAIEKPDGVTRTYGYDDGNRLNVVFGPDGVRRMVNTYDDNGRVILQTFCDGTQIIFEYLKDRTRLTQRNGATMVYFHDEQGRHIATEYPDGARETYIYNEKSQRVGMTDACGERFIRGYSNSGDLLYRVSPLDDREEYTYDDKHHVTQIRHADGSTLSTEYDEAGRMVLMRDEEGAETVCGYLDGRLCEVTGADGAKVSFEYNEQGLVSARKEADGGTTRYEYDALGRLICQTDPLGYKKRFAYDGCDRKTLEVDTAGHEKHFTYDYYGHLSSITDVDGLKETWKYNAMGLCIAYTDKLGRVTHYEHDSMSNVSRVMLPNGGVETSEYDARNRLTKRVNALGAVTTYAYDACGRVTEKTVSADKDGGAAYTFRYEYDACGRLREITRPNGLRSTSLYGRNNRIEEIRQSDGTSYKYHYDKARRVVLEVNAAGQATEYSYHGTGALKRVTYSTGGYAEYDYYPGGRLKTAMQPDGTRYEYAYDLAGNMICRHDSMGQTLHYTYDGMHDPVSIMDDRGHGQRMAYDALGRLIGVTDAEGRETLYSYNPAGRLTEARFPDGSSVRYAYNDMNEMTAMLEGRYDDSEAEVLLTDTVGRQDGTVSLTTWQRDLSGHVTKRTDALGNTECYHYDALGRLLTHTDADANTVDYAYDVEGNVTGIRYSDGRSAVFAYDLKNRPVSMTDWTGETSICYTADGMPLSVTDGAGQTVSYTWENGRLTGLHYPDGLQLFYQYDRAGRYMRIMDKKDGTDIRYQNREDGLGYTRILQNGMTDICETNAFSQLVRQTHEDPNGDQETVEYSYDLLGNLVQEKRRTVKAGKEGIARTDYTYDDMGRLVSAVEQPAGRVYTYQYDAMGNRVAATENGHTMRTEYNALHQAVFSERSDGIRVSYRYDGRGNRIGETWSDGRTVEREFNAQNHLERVKDSARGFSVFTRNGLGQIVGEINEMPGSTREEKHFVLDMNRPVNNLLAELSGKGNKDYLWDRSAVGAVRGSDSEWYRCDRQGSIRAVYDKGGCLLDRVDYTPFGNPLTESALPSIGYTGFYRHQISNTWYAQTREYDPVTGAFLSADRDRYLRHMYPGGVDLYRYCRHNPILWVDLEGTDCYIFYLPEWENEAKNDRRQLTKEYGLDESQVHIVPIRNDADLTNAWNAMGTENGQQVDIDAVIINTHANNSRIGYGSNSNDKFTAEDIRGLENKDVGTLIMLGCNAGHRDHQENIASEFSKKTNGGDVVASDGTVSSGSTFLELTDRSYTSVNDEYYRNQRDEGSERDNKGWQVYRYEDGTLRITDLEDKEMTVRDMIKEARKTSNDRHHSGC